MASEGKKTWHHIMFWVGVGIAAIVAWVVVTNVVRFLPQTWQANLAKIGIS